jgi:hypothetical protein
MNDIKQPDILLQKLDIEDQLSCPVCTNTYYKPVTLLCQHTFCYHCITDDKIQECPVCRTKKFIPINTDTKSPHNILSQITDLYYGTDSMMQIGAEVKEYLEEKNLGPYIQKKTDQRLANMLNNMAVKKKPKKHSVAIVGISGSSLSVEPSSTYNSPYTKYFNLLKYVIFMGLSILFGWIIGGFLLDIGIVIKTQGNFINLIYSFMRVLTLVNVIYVYYKHVIQNCY